MAENSTADLDLAPLIVIVSEHLDPRVRRRIEAEQQADIKTYEELTDEIQRQTDLNKIKEETQKGNDESDPFEEPEAVEETAKEQQNNDQSNNNQPDNASGDSSQDQNTGQSQQPAGGDNSNSEKDGQQQPDQAGGDGGSTDAGDAGGDGDDEDLSSAFESYGRGLPKDIAMRVLKDYIALESSEQDVGVLEHIKTFVYVDLGNNEVKGDTLESVQTLKDPENTIVVINENGSPNADVTLRSRKVAETLVERGVKVFYDLEEGIDYLNELYDVVAGRKKES